MYLFWNVNESKLDLYLRVSFVLYLVSGISKDAVLRAAKFISFVYDLQ